MVRGNNFTVLDHRLLLSLIRGGTLQGFARCNGMAYVDAATQIRRLQKMMHATTYQLVAFEMVYLMETSDDEAQEVLACLPDEEPEPEPEPVMLRKAAA